MVMDSKKKREYILNDDHKEDCGCDLCKLFRKDKMIEIEILKINNL
jgi:hypothetical protein